LKKGVSFVPNQFSPVRKPEKGKPENVGTKNGGEKKLRLPDTTDMPWT